MDTSALSVHDLRHRLETPFGDLGFDFHWIPELQPHTGRDKPVQDYVLADESIEEYLRAAVSMIRLAMTGYRREGKRYMTIAVGCTGGKHRSVAISESLAGRLSGLDSVEVHVRHRDLGRE